MPDNNVKEEEKTEDGKVPEAADAIIEAVKKSLESKSPAPESQPKEDPNKQYQAWRDETKKKMGWNEDQLNYHEQSIRQSQAPLLKDNALLKLKTSHKDYETLEKPFLAEIERYEKAGRIIDTALAEELYFKVKGVEMTAGRYTVPESQPKNKQPDNKNSSRIARGYNPSEPGISGGSSNKESSADLGLSDVEKDHVEFLAKCADQIGLDLTPEEYAKQREEKRSTKRAITDKTVKHMEITPTANPADRDLASLWNRNATLRR